MSLLRKTDRSRLRRVHQRADYERDTTNAILDAMPLAHVGYTIDGQPYVTPTLQWREGDHVYWHGSSASRALRKSENTQVCLTVSLLDGFVLARSGFHHSVNYRSVMLFGEAFKVSDAKEKAARLEALTNAWLPGRSEMVRGNTAQEVKATTILGMKISEGVSKIRAGGPVDDEEDYELPIWAGVVPVTMKLGDPIADERNLPGLEVPEMIKKMKVG